MEKVNIDICKRCGNFKYFKEENVSYMEYDEESDSYIEQDRECVDYYCGECESREIYGITITKEDFEKLKEIDKNDRSLGAEKRRKFAQELIKKYKGILNKPQY